MTAATASNAPSSTQFLSVCASSYEGSSSLGRSILMYRSEHKKQVMVAAQRQQAQHHGLACVACHGRDGVADHPVTDLAHPSPGLPCFSFAPSSCLRLWPSKDDSGNNPRR